MKRFLILALCFVGCFLVFEGEVQAQAVMAGDEMFLEMLKHDIDQTRIEVMNNVMGLTQEEDKAFWPVYNAYRLKSDELADKDLALVKEYAAAYWSLTDEQAKDMAERFFETEVDRKKLLKELYDELVKVLTPVQALKACQLENRMDLLLDLQIVNELPMVE